MTYFRIAAILEIYLFSLLVLLMRIWMAKIFWYAGLVKMSDWQSTILLFEEVYKVPIIAPRIATYIVAFSEVIGSISLVLGLAARFSSVVLMIITIVIQFICFYKIEHYYWMMLLATILFYGAGKCSIDYLICKKNRNLTLS